MQKPIHVIPPQDRIRGSYKHSKQHKVHEINLNEIGTNSEAYHFHHIKDEFGFEKTQNNDDNTNQSDTINCYPPGKLQVSGVTKSTSCMINNIIPAPRIFPRSVTQKSGEFTTGKKFNDHNRETICFEKEQNVEPVKYEESKTTNKSNFCQIKESKILSPTSLPFTGTQSSDFFSKERKEENEASLSTNIDRQKGCNRDLLKHISLSPTMCSSLNTGDCSNKDTNEENDEIEYTINQINESRYFETSSYHIPHLNQYHQNSQGTNSTYYGQNITKYDNMSQLYNHHYNYNFPGHSQSTTFQLRANNYYQNINSSYMLSYQQQSRYEMKLNQAHDGEIMHTSIKEHGKLQEAYRRHGIKSKKIEIVSSNLNAEKERPNISRDYRFPIQNKLTHFELPQSNPLPQNLKGDPRQAKIKTEICIYYARNKICPYGKMCNYAHGEEELRYTKLCQLKRAGLVDELETFRTCPCLSWVMTGTCPFGQRCCSIHDPRVGGSTHSWLPHSDVPIINLGTTINVDRFFHWNVSTINQENPLIDTAFLNFWQSFKKRKEHETTTCGIGIENEEWQDTYALINNIDLFTDNNFKDATKSTMSIKISELQRLSMSLVMSYSSESSGIMQVCSNNTYRDYVYNPRHLIYNELCMIIQVRFFRLLDQERWSDIKRINSNSGLAVVEISREEYDLRRTPWGKIYPYTPNEVCSAHELVFSPLGGKSSRPSIWFDLMPADILTCTHQQVKKIKRTRQRFAQQMKAKHLCYPAKNFFSPYPGTDFDVISDVSKVSLDRFCKSHSFESHPHQPFFHMRPVSFSHSTIQLIRKIILHRIDSLQVNQIFGKNCERATKKLSVRAVTLRNQFQRLKKHEKNWRIPPTIGRDAPVSEDTPVPRCIDLYRAPENCSFPASHIWKSFVDTISADIKTDKNHMDLKDSTVKMKNNSRLQVFTDLSNGRGLNSETIKYPQIICKIGEKHVTESSNETNHDFIDNLLRKWDIVKKHYQISNTNLVYQDIGAEHESNY